jgi:hypothetical protein
MRTAIVFALLATAGLAAPAAAADADPLAAFAPLDAGALSDLSGRQGISLSDQDLTAIAHGGVFVAGDDIQTGTIDFGSSMQSLHGINNQAINTGNNASVNAGLTVQIHLH